MAKKTRKIPKTVLGRSVSLLSGGAAIFAKEVGGRLAGAFGKVDEYAELQLKLRQAQDLVATLGRLKGAAMKVGQLAAVEFSDLLPKEVINVLRQLHDEAPSIPFEDIRRILRKEWGDERLSKVQELSVEPVATASIGQVHKAVIDGRDVAVKIQFPGVASSIDSDLAILKRVLVGFMRLQGKYMPVDELFDEVSKTLRLEVDYKREAKSIRSYREAFQGDDRYVVPSVVQDFSTKRVLTLSFEEGRRIKDWLASVPDSDERKRFSDLVLGLLHKEFFQTGLVQTDPNYGNFLFRPEKNQLVLFDFGAVKRYSKSFRKDCRRILVATMKGDRDAVLQEATRIFTLDEREDPEVAELFLDMMEVVVRMFRPENQPFKYADTRYLEDIRRSSMTFVHKVRYSPPPKELLFLNRKLGGMFHLLKDAGTVIDMRPYWEKMIKTPL